jgi:hypothetical protein
MARVNRVPASQPSDYQHIINEAIDQLDAKLREINRKVRPVQHVT